MTVIVCSIISSGATVALILADIGVVS